MTRSSLHTPPNNIIKPRSEKWRLPSPPLSCSQTTPDYALPQCGRSFNFHKQRSGRVILLFGKYLQRPINRILRLVYDQLALPLSNSPFTATRLRARNGTIKKQPPFHTGFQSSSLLALWPSPGDKPQVL